MNEKNELTLAGSTLELTELVKQNIKYQVTVVPKLEELSTKIYEMLSNEQELVNMEVKDLIKLLDVSNKAQIQPISELTKLVQSITALHEKSVLQEKIAKLEKVVNTLTPGRVEDAEEAEVIYGDMAAASLDDFI